MNKLLFSIIYFILLPFAVNSQLPHFSKVSLPANIAGKKITAVCQDARKVLWVGTSMGIYRFNGMEFEFLVLPGDISHSNITALSALPGHGIVAGTSNGKIFEVKRDTALLLYTDPLGADGGISSVVSDKPGEIWASVLGGGVIRIQGKSVHNFGIDDGLGDNYVYDLVRDHTGRLWVGSDGGLSYALISDGLIKFKNIGSEEGLPDPIVRKIIRGPGNTIIVGMQDRGICVYDFARNSFAYYGQSIGWNDGLVTSLALNGNEVWAGTQKAGIVRFAFDESAHSHLYPLDKSFNETEVRCMLNGYDGDIWIGAGSELFLSQGKKITFTSKVGDYELGNIRTVLVSDSETMWFSNEEAFFRMITLNDGRKLLDKPLTRTGFEKFQVITIFNDHLGYLWLGTFDEGLIRYDPITGKSIRFNESNGLINGSVLSIAGKNGELWFATLGGAARCKLIGDEIDDVSEFTGFGEESGLNNNFIYKVFIDSDNRVWFGTDGEGVTCFQNGKFRNFSLKEGLKSKVIYSIAEDIYGNLWFNSADDGLYRYDGKSFKNITLAQGLSSLMIASVVADKAGNINVFHQHGIDVIDAKTLQVISYGAESGLASSDPELNSVFIDENGVITAGSKHGIITFDQALTASRLAPAASIENVFVFLEPADTASSHSFAYNNNHISFSFYALWYSDPAKINYQYKLNGYTKDWIDTRDRLITFPNLQPGEYSFSVRASLTSDFTNAAVTSYDFTIMPPFWKTTWFMILILGLIFIVLYIYLRFRERKIERMEAIKRERLESQFQILKSQVNPHFLFNSFNTLITIIEDNRDVAVEYVNKLSDFFRSILNYRDKNLIRLDEELDLVEDYLFLQEKRYGQHFTVTIDIPPGIRSSCFIPPMTLQMLLENALKHNAVSAESPLFCSIVTSEGSFLIVSNNINARQTVEPSAGIGLVNIKNRFALLTEKSVQVVNDGKLFSVSLPLLFHE